MIQDFYAYLVTNLKRRFVEIIGISVINNTKIVVEYNKDIEMESINDFAEN